MRPGDAPSSFVGSNVTSNDGSVFMVTFSSLIADRVAPEVRSDHMNLAAELVSVVRVRLSEGSQSGGRGLCHHQAMRSRR